MKTELTGAALFADSLRFTLQQSDTLNPFAAPRPPEKMRAREISWRGHSEFPFKLRDPQAQRRLLVGS